MYRPAIFFQKMTGKSSNEHFPYLIRLIICNTASNRTTRFLKSQEKI